MTATNHESSNHEPWVEWMRGSSIWKGPVLALLLDGPGHSYELSRRLWMRLGPAWLRPSKDIYRLLKEASYTQKLWMGVKRKAAYLPG